MKTIFLFCLIIASTAMAFGSIIGVTNNTGLPAILLSNLNSNAESFAEGVIVNSSDFLALMPTTTVGESECFALLPTTTIRRNQNIALMPTTTIWKSIMIAEQVIFRHPMKCEVVQLKFQETNFTDHLLFRSSTEKGKVNILKHPNFAESAESIHFEANSNNASTT